MNMIAGKPQTIVLIIASWSVCAIVLLGCENKNEGKSDAPMGQIIARVGKEVVTAQELDNELRLVSVAPDKRKDPDVVKRVLGELVTRKYLVQQAMDAKLDRQPTVLLDLLRVREIVLANAAASRDVIAKNSEISKSNIDTYIANNPLKFADRQLIKVEQITFALSSNSQMLIDSSKGSKSLDEIDQKLNSMNVAHDRSMGAIYSGEVPADLYKLIEANNPDDVFFVRSGSNGIYFKVKSQEKQPLEGEKALNVARQYLRADLVKSEVGLASVAANLETRYEGDYAKLMAGPEASQPAAAK